MILILILVEKIWSGVDDNLVAPETVDPCLILSVLARIVSTWLALTNILDHVFIDQPLPLLGHAHLEEDMGQNEECFPHKVYIEIKIGKFWGHRKCYGKFNLLRKGTIISK